jgi:hypothetical protein
LAPGAALGTAARSFLALALASIFFFAFSLRQRSGRDQQNNQEREQIFHRHSNLARTEGLFKDWIVSKLQ